jgi:hypothetical protein
VSIAVRAPDARTVASITRPFHGVELARAEDDWVLRGEPAALQAWLVSHLQELEELERNEPGVQRGVYFAGMQDAEVWFHLEDQLDGTGMRVGWLWDEILAVRALPGERMTVAQTEAETAQVTAWMLSPTTQEQGEQPKWIPGPCPSGDTAPKRYAPPPEPSTAR